MIDRMLDHTMDLETDQQRTGTAFLDAGYDVMDHAADHRTDPLHPADASHSARPEALPQPRERRIGSWMEYFCGKTGQTIQITVGMGLAFAGISGLVLFGCIFMIGAVILLFGVLSDLPAALTFVPPALAGLFCLGVAVLLFFWLMRWGTTIVETGAGKKIVCPPTRENLLNLAADESLLRGASAPDTPSKDILLRPVVNRPEEDSRSLLCPYEGDGNPANAQRTIRPQENVL